MKPLVNALVEFAPVFLAVVIIVWQGRTVCSAQPWQVGGPWGASNGDGLLLLLSGGGLFLLGFLAHLIMAHYDKREEH